MRLAAPGGLDECPHALLGYRLVQEAVHGAVGDLRGEHALLGRPAGHDQHQLRELGMQACGEGSERADDQVAVEHRDPGVMRHQRGRQVELRADDAHLAHRVGDVPQGGE